ncbi:unnamed protein product [Adineta ricciae]|uniref:Uncharacterized protein n=1 Tax=Adineta ricciae TaxID=249248 RepID=A0A816BNG7_ADIRI|nr:unnamed protein product [Adineta ricciae]
MKILYNCTSSLPELNISIISIKSIAKDEHSHKLASYKQSLQSYTMNDSILLFNIVHIIIIFLLIPLVIILRRSSFFLSIFLSFTAGGFMANIFLRLLPDFINLSGITNQQQHNRAGCFILMGVFFSFGIEKFLRHLQRTLLLNSHDEQTDFMTSANTLIFLVLLTNVLHNFTNNLDTPLTFINRSIFDLTEATIKISFEILHVLYGYIIFLNCGWTPTKAMRYFLLTAMISSIVCVSSVQFQSYTNVQNWSNQILSPIMAGTLIYISTVHIIPKVMKNNQGTKTTLLKAVASIMSVFIVLSLKQYEKVFFRKPSMNSIS